MTPQENFIIDHWEKKSNAILGFIVFQSILLADGLSRDGFMNKIKSVGYLNLYLFCVHTALVIISVVLLVLIDMKVSRKLGSNEILKKDIELHLTLSIKIFLAILFGLIPIFIFYKNL